MIWHVQLPQLHYICWLLKARDFLNSSLPWYLKIPYCEMSLEYGQKRLLLAIAYLRKIVGITYFSEIHLSMTMNAVQTSWCCTVNILVVTQRFDRVKWQKEAKNVKFLHCYVNFKIIMTFTTFSDIKNSVC